MATSGIYTRVLHWGRFLHADCGRSIQPVVSADPATDNSRRFIHNRSSTGLTDSGVIGDYVGPVVVKSSAGSIEGTVEGATATGKIVDKYVDYQAELVRYTDSATTLIRNSKQHPK